MGHSLSSYYVPGKSLFYAIIIIIIIKLIATTVY